MDLNRKIAEYKGWTEIDVCDGHGLVGLMPEPDDGFIELAPHYDEWPDAGELLEEMVESEIPVEFDCYGKQIGLRWSAPSKLEQHLSLADKLPAAIRAAYAEWKGLTNG